ncbi:hypothetical protein JCM1840_007632 [Sporobolomyces johnsonii]
MSTVYHPQSDGVTERLNQSLKLYLRLFVNYTQDDWEELLPLAAFIHNDTIHSSTKSTLFFIIYGFHPRFTVTFKDFGTKPLDADTASRASTLAALHQTLHHELEPRHNKNEDAIRQEARRRSQKLDHYFLGPYPIKECVGDLVYCLDLPAETYRGKLRYLIKWRSKIQTDWLDAQDLDHAQELVHAFHEAYPNKPKAPAVRQSGRRRKGGEHE